MGGLEADTVGGYNSMLEKQKAIDGECCITTVLFDNTYELFHDRIDIKAVNPITSKEYFIGGSTALLDAIGKTIHKIGIAQRNTTEDYRAEKVMFVIITDGEENSSREYTHAKVKAQIERQKIEFEWEFIFLGANIDAVNTAGHYGIGADRAAQYLSDKEGTNLNYSVMSDAISEFRKNASISDVHFEKIRKDVKKRG